MAELVGILGIGWLISKMVETKSSQMTFTEMSPLDIASKIHSGEIPVLRAEDHKLDQEIERVEQTVDHMREFKDLSTDIIVKHFLSNDTCMFNFLELVYGSFYSAIEEFKTLNNLNKWDVFFVYKGGNVLRIISNDFLNELPRIASTKINDYYEKFFKRSDADFSIYIKPTIKNYDEVYAKLTTMSYYLQVKIREEFSREPSKYFEFFKYNTEQQNKILEEYSQKVEGSRALSDINNTIFYNKKCDGLTFGDAHSANISRRYEGHRDLGLQFKDEKTITMYLLDPTENMLFIQANETLDFPAGGNRTKFNLVRTKIGFNYIFNGKTIIIGGELIDVSLPHRLDNNVGHFFEHTNYISQYQLSFAEKKLVFYSYTLKYLASDLEYILFDFVNVPWKTPKYEKRLNRLFYLYFIDLFLVLGDNTERRNIIKRIQNGIFNKSIKKDEYGSNIVSEVLPALRKLLSGSDRFNSKLVRDGDDPDSSRLMFYNLLVRLENILVQVERSEDPSDVNNYNAMMDVLKENCKFVLTAFSGITEYCSTEGKINMKILYNNEFSALIE
jgi:hypothetical protein